MQPRIKKDPWEYNKSHMKTLVKKVRWCILGIPNNIQNFDGDVSLSSCVQKTSSSISGNKNIESIGK